MFSAVTSTRAGKTSVLFMGTGLQLEHFKYIHITKIKLKKSVFRVQKSKTVKTSEFTGLTLSFTHTSTSTLKDIGHLARLFETTVL